MPAVRRSRAWKRSGGDVVAHGRCSASRRRRRRSKWSFQVGRLLNGERTGAAKRSAKTLAAVKPERTNGV